MGIFDMINNLKNKAVNTVKAALSHKETFTFNTLPQDLDEMKALPEASLDSPYKTAALTVCALCAYANDKEKGTEMLNFLRGPRPMTPQDISFLNDRLMDGKVYVLFSFFDGAVPGNDYAPNVPYTITVKSNQYSDDNQGYKKLFVKSGGADTERAIILRQTGGGLWYLWQQEIMADIRKPTSQDPWAR